jgi:hypothetical protein
MGPEYSAGNVTTGVMVILTIWTVISRFRFRTDANWPLIYYLFVVIYHQWAPGRLNPWAIYAGVVSALLLRFEFMGGGFLRLIRFIEVGVLLALTWNFFTLVRR